MPIASVDGLDAGSTSAAVKLLESLCAESSPSTDPGGLARFASRLASELRARGWRAQVDSVESEAGSLPVLIAESRQRVGETKPLLLLGHFDTVLPAAPTELAGDRLRATGAIDMKGGIATLLAAIDLLARRREAPPPSRLLLVPDEEVAGPVSRRETAAHGAEARAVWVLEPGDATPDGGETIVVGRRGLSCFRLSVTGRSAHSGLDFARGRSATAAAARWCAAAAALSDARRGPTVNVSRLVGGDREFVEHLATEAHLLGGEARLNVVADRALVEGEYRIRSRADGETTRGRLESLAAEEGIRSEVEIELAFFGDVPPVEPTPERLAYAERARGLALQRGWSLAIEADRGGVSFPNFLPAGSTVPILDGLGPVGGGMHTRAEHVDLRSFARRIVLLADLLADEAAAQR